MRRRILLLVVGMTTLVVLAFAIPLVVLIHNNAYSNGIDGLRTEANSIAIYLRSENSIRTAAQIRADLSAADSHRDASVEVDGTVIGRQPPGGIAQTPPVRFGFGTAGSRAPSGVPSPDTSSGSTGGSGGPEDGGFGGPRNGDVKPIAYRGGRLVQFTVPKYRETGEAAAPAGTGGFYVVRVYATDGVLRSKQTAPLLLLGGVAVVLLLAGAAAGEVLTRRIVRPLVETAATAQQLSAGDTLARAPTSGPTSAGR